MSKRIRQIRVDGNLAYVPLTQGYEAVIDAWDVPLVAGHNWYANVERRKDGSIRAIYALRRFRKACGNQGTIMMHRVIDGTPEGLGTDHRDGDGLNNRRGNLRSATTAQNAQNQGLKTTNTSGFKGVSFIAGKGKWQAEITHNRKRHYLGLFPTIDEASSAYANASAKLHGSYGRADMTPAEQADFDLTMRIRGAAGDIAKAQIAAREDGE